MVTGFRNGPAHVKLTVAEPSLTSFCKRRCTRRIPGGTIQCPLGAKACQKNSEDTSTWLGNLKARALLAGIEARPARAHTILSILVLIWFWGTALLVALNDIDFFSLEDLFDTAHPHHEHIVVALVVGGIVVALITFQWGRRRRNGM